MTDHIAGQKFADPKKSQALKCSCKLFLEQLCDYYFAQKERLTKPE